MLKKIVIYLSFSIVSFSGILYAKTSPVDLVYPLLDTEHSRWIFFASASRPFGMVNLSPDTRINGAWESGYIYGTNNVKGFSHIHAWQMSGVSVMPVSLTSYSKEELFQDPSSDFSHEKEIVKPGYHKLYLDRYGINVELTSTKRVGFHHYRYPDKQGKAILFNLNGELGPCKNENGKIDKIDAYTLSGQLTNAATVRRPKAFKVFFIAKFNCPIDDIFVDDETGNYMVKVSDNAKDVYMKIGLSYTSVENALENMNRELPDWDFSRIVKESYDEWNGMLSRIEVSGGSKADKRRFYTDLWHALQGRRTINDCNGAYPDYTKERFRIGQIPLSEAGIPIHNHYNSDAFWGAQFSLNILWGLVYPDIYEDFVHSLIRYYKDGGMVPRGPSGGNYTFVMTGASSTPFIVSAVQKGIISDSLNYIYAALKKNHLPGGIMEKAGYEHNSNTGGGLKYYMKQGYVPYPNPEKTKAYHQDGAGMTMEYAYQDFALSQMALRIGEKDDYAYFYDRSMNYKNLYDTVSGFIRPKDKDGIWMKDFDPYQYKHGFVESNSAQMTWFVPHDIPGLATLMGGNAKAAERLDAQFKEAAKLNFTSGSSHAAELHPEYSRIPINYGNQPSIQTAFIFHRLGYPSLSQYWSRQVVDKAFSGISPTSGYNGDEDQGIMGSVSVLMKLGIFQVDGGVSLSPDYQIGSPIFDKIRIHLHNDYYKGNFIDIKTYHGKKSSPILDRLYWNGKSIEGHSISHQELVRGGILNLYTK